MSETQSPTSLSTPTARGNVRKRVVKACNRCRIKKAKCDGLIPCRHCKTFDDVCIFGPRKKSVEKVYPKGYVEMLEQRQARLVAGMQELARRTRLSLDLANRLNPHGFQQEPGPAHTPIHELLESLGALEHDCVEDDNDDDGDDGDDESQIEVKLESPTCSEARTDSRGDVSGLESDSSRLSSLDPLSAQSVLSSDPFALHQAPMTPPMHGSPVGPSQQYQSLYPAYWTGPEPLFDASGDVNHWAMGRPNHTPDSSACYSHSSIPMMFSHPTALTPD